MSVFARVVLLASAVLCGVFLAILGGAFSHAVDPERHVLATSAYWGSLAGVFVAPMWLPALIPQRFARTLKVCRRVAAVAQLFPLAMFGNIVVHNVSRMMSGEGGSDAALALGLVLTSLCIACLVILLRPQSVRASPA